MKATPRDLQRDPRYRALFAEPPETFVRARDALARDLAASRDPAAGQVRALRRPTREVWLLNALAREAPEEVAALLDAGARLRAAHEAALRGRRDAGLRGADEDMSRRLDDLVVRGGRLAAGGGAPPHALLVALRGDLRALATAGGGEAERLRSGILERAPRAAADDALEEALRASTAGASPERTGSVRPAPGSVRRERRSDAGAASKQQSASKRAAAALERRRAAEERRRAAEEARRAARERRGAEHEVRRARAALEGADEDLRQAQRAVETARRAMTEREEAAARAAATREAARERLAAAERQLSTLRTS